MDVVEIYLFGNGGGEFGGNFQSTPCHRRHKERACENRRKWQSPDYKLFAIGLFSMAS